MERNISTRPRVHRTQENAPISSLPGKSNIAKRIRNPLNEVQNKHTNLACYGAAKQHIGPLKSSVSITIGLFKPSVTKPQTKPVISVSTKDATNKTLTKKPVKDENLKPSLLPNRIPTKTALGGLNNKPVTITNATVAGKKMIGPLKSSAPTDSLLKTILLKPQTKAINPAAPTTKYVCDKIPENNHVKEETTNSLIARTGRIIKPKSCFDVDREDDPMLIPEYATDIFKYLKSLEHEYSIPKNHMKNSHVTPSMRSILIDWMAEVCHSFSMVTETLHISISLVDRYLVANKKIDKNTLQLVGVVAMFIASKYEELSLPTLEDWLFVCDHTFSRREILRMEFDILKRLDFTLTRPTAISFLRRYHKVVAATGDQHELGKYMIDLALMDYTMCSYAPSIHAAAACCLARFLVKEDITILSEVWCELIEYHANYCFDEIKGLVYQYAQMLLNAETSKQQTIRNIYSQNKYRAISKKSVLKGTKLKNLTFRDQV